MLEIVVMCGGVGDGENGRSGVGAAVVESVDVGPVVEDVGVFAVAVAMGVAGAHGIDEAGGVVVRVVVVIGGGVGGKGAGDGVVVEIPVAVAVVVEGVRVTTGDDVDTEFGIAVGGGACRVDNTDGIVAVAAAVVVGVVDVEGMDSVDEASGGVKVAVAANNVAACGRRDVSGVREESKKRMTKDKL